jgi:alpha-N-arabinofuranosidase
VNAIGLIRSEPDGPAWRQTIFHPFALTSRYGRGTVLRTPVVAARYETSAYGPVPLVDAVAVLSPDDRGLVVFAVNRDEHEALPVTVDLRALPDLKVASHTCVGGDDSAAANTRSEPSRVVPRVVADDLVAADGSLRVLLPPLSWNMLRIRRAMDDAEAR